jgi:hypothetical protein
MHVLDWLVVAVYLIWALRDGVRRTTDSGQAEVKAA